MSQDHDQLKDAYIEALRSETDAGFELKSAREAFDAARQRYEAAKIAAKKAERALRIGMNQRPTRRWAREDEQ